jgi:hypothetical protein
VAVGVGVVVVGVGVGVSVRGGGVVGVSPGGLVVVVTVTIGLGVVGDGVAVVSSVRGGGDEVGVGGAGVGEVVALGSNTMKGTKEMSSPMGVR